MPKRARSDGDENYYGGLVKAHISRKRLTWACCENKTWRKCTREPSASSSTTTTRSHQRQHQRQRWRRLSRAQSASCTSNSLSSPGKARCLPPAFHVLDLPVRWCRPAPLATSQLAPPASPSATPVLRSLAGCATSWRCARFAAKRTAPPVPGTCAPGTDLINTLYLKARVQIMKLCAIIGFNQSYNSLCVTQT